jgi:hypothetical protein
MFIQPIECDRCHRKGDSGGIQISSQLGVDRAHCQCGSTFEVSSDQLVLSANEFSRLRILSNHTEYGTVAATPGISTKVTFKRPFEFACRAYVTPVVPDGFLVLFREHFLQKDSMLVLNSVLREEHLKPVNPISFNWHVFGLVEINMLPAWYLQYYSALTHLINGLFKPALLDYGTAFELFLETFLRKRLTASVGQRMTDYLLEKAWRIDERIKDLLEQVCGQRLTARLDVYQPWDEYVRKPRNELSHGKKLGVDEPAAERAHQATWQTIKWIESLP